MTGRGDVWGSEYLTEVMFVVLNSLQELDVWDGRGLNVCGLMYERGGAMTRRQQSVCNSNSSTGCGVAVDVG